MRYVYLIFTLTLLFSSCAKKKAAKQAAADDAIIVQYISDHGLTATKTESGLYYVIESQGTGVTCNANSNVQVYYKGYYTNGEVFDESSTSGAIFNLQSVIAGWTEGIPHFRKGGIGKLLIPSALAYGKNGSGSVPGNTVLIFDVKLIDVL